MPVHFNHLAVAGKDKQRSATFLKDGLDTDTGAVANEGREVQGPADPFIGVTQRPSSHCEFKRCSHLSLRRLSLLPAGPVVRVIPIVPVVKVL